MDKDLPLRNDIRRLGDLLGETLKGLCSKNLFATEERVRALCKQLRAKPAPSTERNLRRLLRGLNLDEAIDVIRAPGLLRSSVTVCAPTPQPASSTRAPLG